MRARVALTLGSLLAGGLYWQLVSMVTGAAEPWDDGAYWLLWYPLALLMCAGLGYFLGGKGGLGSVMLIVAQLPVLWVSGEASPFMIVGLLFTVALAVPAIAVSLTSAMIAKRLRSS